MKTILVPTEQANGMASTLETAVLVACKFGSYIEGFALRFAVNELLAEAAVGMIPVAAIEHDSLEEAKHARGLFERFMQERSVPRMDGSKATLSFGWQEDAGEGPYVVGSLGRAFDVTVMGRPSADTSGLHNSALESSLFESGHPILLAPPSSPQQIGTNILIAWNGSTEQARATTFAMPFLQRADSVTVLTVKGGTGVAGPTGVQLCRYLQLNGVPANSHTVDLAGRSTGEAILATANSLGCDLLIKGAYTQSRLRQMIFGGATRHILAHAALPVLMAH
jgi:nucleotide-binding universal stress UspA family protein